jgi:hypothetical protein
MNSFVVALVYAVVLIAVVPIGFAVFKTPHTFIDVCLAAIGGAALSLIPTAGGVASLLATVSILFWRIRGDLFPDILVTVGVARLVMVPVLLLLIPK